MTLRYGMGSNGSAHLITRSLNLHPIRNMGMLKLLEAPMSPHSPEKITSILHPIPS